MVLADVHSLRRAISLDVMLLIAPGIIFSSVESLVTGVVLFG